MSARKITTDKDKYLKLSAQELAPEVLRFRGVWNSERKAQFERRSHEWWDTFLAKPRSMTALRAFEAARLAIRRRTRESVNHDLITLWRLARGSYSAVTWNKLSDPGNRYRSRIAIARRQREKLSYHARQLAKGLSGWPPGLSWALRSASLNAGVGSIRDKLRKEVMELPPQISEAERAATVKRLKLDEERSIAKMWPEFFNSLADELLHKLPEIDGGPWYRLYTIGNLHYNKRIEGKLPELETMLAFELTFHLRRWSLGHANHSWSSSSPMPKGGKPYNEVAASFVNAALNLPRGVTGEQIGNRLKRLPKNIGLIGWFYDDG